jgi:phage shock protein PspC (stress-responsive transcriptional regulator)
MKCSSNNKWHGGVLGGIANSIGVDPGLLRVVFIVLFFGVGGLSFGIGWGAVTLISFLMLWIINFD